MAVLAVQALCSYLQTYWLAAVGERGLADLRRDTYARLIHLPMAFFAGRRVGELASRLAADLALIQQTFTGTLPHFLGQMVMLAGGLVLITLTSGRLTLVMLASVPLVIGLAVVFGKLTRKVAREGQDRLADTNVVVEETLQGRPAIKKQAPASVLFVGAQHVRLPTLGFVLRFADREPRRTPGETKHDYRNATANRAPRGHNQVLHAD
jgi:ATP-binding cassette subfamily B protein